MKLRAHTDIPTEPFAVGNTVPDMMPFLGVPFWHVPAIFVVAAVITAITRSPVWLVCSVLVMIFADRQLLSLNFNRPRELWLALRSGSTLADRTVFGGESAAVHLPRGESVGPR